MTDTPAADTPIPTLTAVPYQLRLGVVGHRKLADPAGAGAASDQLMRSLKSIMTGTPRVQVEWVVISPAALGADRVLAQSAMEQLSARLEVVTPMPLDEYRKDFDSAEDRAEFESLIKKADRLVELHHHEPDPGDVAARRRAYTDVGRAVVDSCEVLVAIWDGKPSATAGGTGDAVRYALEAGRTVIVIDANDPAAPPRLLGRSRDADRSMPVEGPAISAGLFELRDFLGTGSLSPDAFAHGYRHAVEKLRQFAQTVAYPTNRLEVVMRTLLPFGIHAGELSANYQRAYVAACKSVFYLSAFAVSMAVAQALFFSSSVWPTIVELLAMLAAIGIYLANRRGAWHEKWLHSRFVSEQLRMALFTLIVGEDPTEPLTNTHRALPFYAGPQQWVPATVRAIVARTRAALPPEPDVSPAAQKFIIDGWLKHQQAWHARNAHRKEKLAEHARYKILGAFFATFIAAAVHLTGTMTHGAHHKPSADRGATESVEVVAEAVPAEHPLWLNLFTFAAMVLPAWGAAAHGISKQLEYERVAARSHQMSMVLARLVDRAAAANPADFRALVHEAGRLIALENYEWWVVLSFDPPELVA